MKRFWQHAAAVPDADGFAVTLDHRPVRLPDGTTLRLRSRALADAVAAEWQAAPAEFGYENVPLTQLAGTAQQRIAACRDAVVVELARYAESDLLCYRAPVASTLGARQAAAWQPWLDWAASRYGARLEPTEGIRHKPQDTAALAKLASAVAALDDEALAALGALVPALGSLVLALAVLEGTLSAADAYDLSVLDDLFQEEAWGADSLAVARRAKVAQDVVTAARFADCARS